jgi:hypothetical protein
MFIKNLMTSTFGGKILIKSMVLALLMGLFANAAPVLAYYPSLNINSSGSDNVTISVNGAQPNSSIALSYTPSGSTLATTITNFGYTDYSGNYTTSASANSYGFSYGSQIYVSVAGQQSNTVNYSGGYNGGCTYNCGSPSGNTLTLSPSALNITTGQSAVVNIINYAYYGSGYLNNVYISSNSNSSVASASVSGGQITVYGITSGYTTVSVCQSGSTAGCSSLYVNVTGSNTGCSYYNNCGNNISLSKNSLSLTAGQSSTITIYNNNNYNSYNSFYISGNTNSSVASASVSSNNLYVYGLISGSTTINVCQTNNSSNCSSLYVTVTGSNGCNYGSCGGTLSFSQTSLTITLGQSSVVTAYNSNSGSLYVNSNSNASVASVSINGSSINIYGINTGSSIINICNNSTGQCGTIYVTVGNNGGNGNNISLSQTSVSMTPGQSTTLNIYGSGGFYVNANGNASVVTATISGSTLYLNSLGSGNSTISVCQNLGNSQCVSLYVTVSGGSTGNGAIWFSQNTANLNIGQSSTVTIYSNNYGGGYYISSNPNPGFVTANVVGNQLNLYGKATGYSTVTVCQSQGSGSSNCGSIYIGVNNSGNGNNGGVVVLSQNNLSLTQGQSGAINLNGNGGYYVSTNSNSSVASATLNNSVLNVYGGTAGSTTINICQTSYPTSCAALYVTVLGSGSIGGGVLGSNAYANGTLISENGTVYITYKNLKTPFANANAFIGLGFNFNNVISVGFNSLINSGYMVNSAYVQHPWGSWIKSGNTVYFVHQNGLIPVPDWNTFIGNGGPVNGVVNSNAWDFGLPMLPVMVYNDSRLQ